MTTIKFGAYNIPVFSRVTELSGTNVVANPSLGDIPFYEIYAEGTTVGSGFVEYQYAVNDCSFTGGRTPLHNDCELIVTNPYSAGGSALAPQWNIDGTIVHQDGQQAIQLDSGTITLVAGLTPTSYTNRVYEHSFHLTAVPFKWTSESLPEEQRVMNYKIYPTWKTTQKNTQTGAETVSYDYFSPFVLNLAYINKRNNLYTYIDEEDEPEDPFDPSEPDDYTPAIDDTSDTITLPTDPPIGVTKAGFINVYNPPVNALQGLGDILFPNVASATDIVDAVIKLCETLANQNLINYVIDCHVIPVTPQTGANANIKVGFRDTFISVPTVTSDYVIVSCGSLNIAEYFHGFQDYLLTKSKLYLPFIGFVDTLPEFWQAGTISVDYKFNVIDGSFMAYVRATSSKSQLSGSVIQQYAGNACMHFPITGVNYASMVSGLIGAVTAPAATGSNVSSALGKAYSAANTVAMGGDVQQSNGYNSTAAILGVRTPFLMIERPVASYPAGYAHSKAYPSNIATLLSNVTGFTIIEDIDLSGIPLTQTELEELRGLLKEGIYF